MNSKTAWLGLTLELSKRESQQIKWIVWEGPLSPHWSRKARFNFLKSTSFAWSTHTLLVLIIWKLMWVLWENTLNELCDWSQAWHIVLHWQANVCECHHKKMMDDMPFEGFQDHEYLTNNRNCLPARELHMKWITFSKTDAARKIFQLRTLSCQLTPLWGGKTIPGILLRKNGSETHKNEWAHTWDLGDFLLPARFRPETCVTPSNKETFCMVT